MYDIGGAERAMAASYPSIDKRTMRPEKTDEYFASIKDLTDEHDERVCSCDETSRRIVEAERRHASDSGELSLIKLRANVAHR
jgi:hypothetical protein